MNPIETLITLSGKTAPGRPPDFTPAHLLKALKVINEIGPGRKQLAADLNLGEGTIRNLIGRLVDESFVSISRQGLSLTEKGQEFMDDLKSMLMCYSFPDSEMTVAEYNHITLIKGVSDKVRYGVEQRDAALLAGAKGATTLIIADGEVVMPGVTERLGDAEKKFILNLAPEEGDVLIVGSAESPFFAEMGAIAAALELLV
ncbi:MAG: winged helix-turn-helix domain-containing protein [Candidatus Bathyarchaeota archaeon]|nr:winged helix-turn-helix domain-containing protein [Candidatus Bathyarchaeota archaeon]